ncbi:MAG TPA: ABC transporter permease [Acidimicrobiales bacterium]|nr:ABC transporter permease [Acidimicrobiales bacterium]
MSNFLQYTVFGVMFGAGYAIAATGLVVTYTTSGVFNFAQGAVGMVAAFTYWQLVSEHHVPILVALLLILVVGASISGALVERVLMRRLHGASAERPVMVTLGLLVILTGFATLTWSPTTQHLVGDMVNGQFRLVGINIQYQEVLIIGVAAAVAIALRLLFYSTRTGVALRAVVDDPELLAMSGASPNRMSQYGWILGFVMAALAGVLLAPTQTAGLSIAAMTLLVVNGYAAAIVGRLRNIPVTFAAAIGIGLAENYVISYLLPHLPQSLVPDVTLALPMVFLFIALVTVPSVRLRAVGRLTTMRAPRVAGGRESLVAGASFLVLAVVAAVAFDNTAFKGTTILDLGGVVMCLGIVGLSLVLVTGYSGQISLCQFSFMGIGAFVMGKVAGGGSLFGLLAATLICAAVGALIALPTIRLRDLYLALATFAFADAIFYGFFNDTHIYGSGGVSVGRIVLPGLSFGGDRAEFLMVTAFFVLAALMVLAIRRSLFGRRLVALNDSPAAYATVGLNIGFTKVAVFAIAAGMAGLAGALYGTVQQTVGTSDFDIFPGIIFVLFVTVWSIRTVTGAFLAALTYVVLGQVWLNGLGLFAGLGIILIGRAAGGILGIEALHFRLPWVKRQSAGSLGAPGALIGGPAVVGGETRAAG